MYCPVMYLHTQESAFVQKKETLAPMGAGGGAESHGRPQQKDTFGGYDCEFVEPPTRTFQTHMQFNTPRPILNQLL